LRLSLHAEGRLRPFEHLPAHARSLQGGDRRDRGKSAAGVRGLRAEYWGDVWDRWLDTAYVCRYGHQDVYRVLGRDPFAYPLTPLERQIFIRALQVHIDVEVNPR